MLDLGENTSALGGFAPHPPTLRHLSSPSTAAAVYNDPQKEPVMKHLLIAAALLVAPQGGVAQDKVAAASFAGLAEDQFITDKLVAAQVGDILRSTCPQVSARMFVVLSEMLALERRAKAGGHDDAAIRAFLKDRAQKQRIRALADAYLAKAGAKAGDSASFCAVARAEVAAQTMAGQLLRVAR